MNQTLTSGYANYVNLVHGFQDYDERKEKSAIKDSHNKVKGVCAYNMAERNNMNDMNDFISGRIIYKLHKV